MATRDVQERRDVLKAGMCLEEFKIEGEPSGAGARGGPSSPGHQAGERDVAGGRLAGADRLQSGPSVGGRSVGSADGRLIPSLSSRATLSDSSSDGDAPQEADKRENEDSSRPVAEVAAHGVSTRPFLPRRPRAWLVRALWWRLRRMPLWLSTVIEN